MSAEQQAARRCEGGESAGSSAGATGASPRLHQQPQHRSHLAAKVTKLLKTDRINSRNSGSATSCASRHLGFSDDVTSIPKATLLAAIILDFDSIPCGEAGIDTVGAGKTRGLGRGDAACCASGVAFVVGEKRQVAVRAAELI